MPQLCFFRYIPYICQQRHDIFVSFRFHEAMDQAKELKQKLNARGVTTFVCNNVSAGESIKELVIEKLDKASLVIVLGTETCKYLARIIVY